MVPHVAHNAPRALLRARCARAPTSCNAVPVYSCPRRTGSHATTRQGSRHFSSSAPALVSTGASTSLPARPRWLEANAVPHRCARRSYATAPGSGLPADIAVLGGGLTGLTTAYYLTRFSPDARVTIYESQARVGGWIDTEKVQVTTLAGTDETIRFERGARVVSPQSSLTRYEDFVLYDLVCPSCRPALDAHAPCPVPMLTRLSDRSTEADGSVSCSVQGRPCAEQPLCLLSRPPGRDAK